MTEKIRQAANLHVQKVVPCGLLFVVVLLTMRQTGQSGRIMGCTVWALIQPAETIPGEWVAHCLHLDVVSQGRSIEHALDMLREALEMIVSDDIAQGLDPLDRHKAPDEDWLTLASVIKNGRPLAGVPDKARVTAAAVPLHIIRPHVEAIDGEDTVQLPEPWVITALESLRNSQSAHC